MILVASQFDMVEIDKILLIALHSYRYQYHMACGDQAGGERKTFGKSLYLIGSNENLGLLERNKKKNKNERTKTGENPYICSLHSLPV